MSADLEYVGRVVAGRYRLEEILGRGGFGAVYRAWDVQMERAVAVKMLAAPPQDTAEARELRARFVREARSAGRINHNAVVTIFDFDELPDGASFLAMELLDGLPLSRHLARNGPLPPAAVKELFLPVLRALGKGHDLGIVHKDLKPGNLFLTHPGTPEVALRLTDFGVARVLHEERLTMTGLLVGTPQYLAPEYIERALVTPALDVYQAALVMIETIVGMPPLPHREPLLTTCRRHFEGDYEVPDGLMEGEFGDFLRRALATNPDERIQNATELADALEPIDMSAVVLTNTETLQFVRSEEEVHSMPLIPPTPLAELGRAGVDETADSMADTVAGEMDGIDQLRASAALTAPPTANASEAPTLFPDDFQPSVPTEEQPPPPMRAPVVRTPTIISNLPDSEYVPQPSKRNVGLLAAALALFVLIVGVGGFAIMFGVFASDDREVPSQPPAAHVEVAQGEKTVEEPEPELEPEPESEPEPEPQLVLLQSEPAGASVMVDGEEVGKTPVEVEATGGVAELTMDGYKSASVTLGDELALVTLEKVPKPAAKKRADRITTPKPQPKQRKPGPVKFAPAPARWDKE